MRSFFHSLLGTRSIATLAMVTLIACSGIARADGPRMKRHLLGPIAKPAGPAAPLPLPPKPVPDKPALRWLELALRVLNPQPLPPAPPDRLPRPRIVVIPIQ